MRAIPFLSLRSPSSAFLVSPRCPRAFACPCVSVSASHCFVSVSPCLSSVCSFCRLHVPVSASMSVLHRVIIPCTCFRCVVLCCVVCRAVCCAAPCAVLCVCAAPFPGGVNGSTSFGQWNLDVHEDFSSLSELNGHCHPDFQRCYLEMTLFI